MTLLLRSGEWDEVTPESAGWDHLSFRVVHVDGRASFDLGEREVAIVPISGDATVTAEGASWEVGGRADVWSGLPRSLYLPRDTPFEISGRAELAFCCAVARHRFQPVAIPPEAVTIEVRGSGNATRQISHIVPPEFPADRILVVEVYTPAGNWSSYPPHKHDVHNPPGEVDLEEIYYYRIDRPEGYAIQRVYSSDGRLDETITVRDGDLVLIPEGYHPVVAAHGYNVYYLNALAGSARSMAASDDPDYAWVRKEWTGKDPRVPVVS
jgi:5-deoxy-glucuronate isomerase